MRFAVVAVSVLLPMAAIAWAFRACEGEGPPSHAANSDSGREAPQASASQSVDAPARRVVAEDADHGAVDVSRSSDGRTWWRKIIEESPKNEKFPHVPAEARAFLHFSLSHWRPEKRKRWRLEVGDMVKEIEINPDKKVVSPAVQEGLREAIATYVDSLRALEEGFELHLVV